MSHHHQFGKIAAGPLLARMPPQTQVPRAEPEDSKSLKLGGRVCCTFQICPPNLVPTFCIPPWAPGGTSPVPNPSAPLPLALGGARRGVLCP